MKNSLLKKVKRRTQKLFELEWAHDNILYLRGDDSNVFAQILYQDTHPNTVLISIAVDCTDAIAIGSLVHSCMYITNTELAEPFYIDTEGVCHFGDNAYLNYELDNNMGYIPVSTSKAIN